jgi:uncharacterized protein (TIGR04552 family)
MSKQETIAAQIFDKLRFRVVTRSRDDILPVLHYLQDRLFPFNYVVPGQSVSSVFGFRSYLSNTPASPLLDRMQPRARGADEDVRLSTENQFSANSYRIIHFVVDMPVRLPKRILDRAPASARPLGNVIFVICEFQIVDRDTEAHNEVGEASHARYKDRQKKAVMRRLQLGSAGDGARTTPEAGSASSSAGIPSTRPRSTSPGSAEVRKKK